MKRCHIGALFAVLALLLSGCAIKTEFRRYAGNHIETEQIGGSLGGRGLKVRTKQRHDGNATQDAPLDAETLKDLVDVDRVMSEEGEGNQEGGVDLTP